MRMAVGTGITTTTSTDPRNSASTNSATSCRALRRPRSAADRLARRQGHGRQPRRHRAGERHVITGAVLNYGDHGLNYNFGELLPGSISRPRVTPTGPRLRFRRSRHSAGGRADRFARRARQCPHDDVHRTPTASTSSPVLRPAATRSASTSRREYYDGGERIGSAGGSDVRRRRACTAFSPASDHVRPRRDQYDFCEKIGVNLVGQRLSRSRRRRQLRPARAKRASAACDLKLLDASGNDTGNTRHDRLAVGYYKFTNLAAGTYTRPRSSAAGWLDGKDTPGNLGGVADVSPPGDQISQIMINWGDDGIEYNFGELLPGSIRGRVHADRARGLRLRQSGHHCSKACRSICSTPTATCSTRPTRTQTASTSSPASRRATYSVREHQPTEYFDGGERIGTAGGSQVRCGRVVQHLHGHQHRRRISTRSSTTSARSRPARSAAASTPIRARGLRLRRSGNPARRRADRPARCRRQSAGNDATRTQTASITSTASRRANTRSANISRPEYYDGGERVGTVGGDVVRRRRSVQHLHGIMLAAGRRRHPVRLLREGRRDALGQRVPRPRQRRRTSTARPKKASPAWW